MINEIRALREKIGSLENQLKDTKFRLSAIETSCTHKWSPIEADHIYHEGYSYGPDGAGSDWRPGGYIPAKTEKRWKRTCSVCGKVEYTSNTTQEVVDHPKFY